MKLNEFIVENILTQFRTAAGASLSMNNPGNPDGSHVVAIKQALRKHTIVTGIDANGNYQTAGPAWSGDNAGLTPDGKVAWDQTLDDAIKTWKNSINIQLGDPNKLNIALGELRQEDVRLLTTTKLVPADGGQLAGLLQQDNDGTSDGNQAGQAPWAGQKVSLQHTIDTPVAEVTTTAQMIAAIGFSGWYYILQELLNKREENTRTIRQSENARLAELNRMMTTIYERQNQFGSVWLEEVWKRGVVLRISRGLTATLANGEEMEFSPPDWRNGSRTQEAQQLYEYFRQLATGLIAKFKQQSIEADAARNAPDVIDTPTLNAATTQAWVQAMNTAFENSVVAGVLPGGRQFGYDREKISDLMNQLNTAGDWDQVEQAYNIQFEDLSAQLVDELSDEDYQSIVVRRLTALRRINPKLMFASIAWGTDTDTMDVSVEDENYSVEKQLNSSGFPVVKKGSTEVKDVLVIDAALKAAIELSGGSVPNLNIEANDEHRAMAGAIIVTVIDMRVPEMTAFYTMQEPFSESQFKAIGPRRILGILEGASVLIANGSSDESTAQWIHGQVMDDRLWLIGDESQDIEGAANIHFDSKYRDESEQSDGFNTGGGFDDVENTDEETDLINRLLNPTSRDAALAEINQISPETEMQRVYDRIYIGYKKNHGKYLDEDITEADELVKYIESEANDIPDSFASIMGSIGVPYAAPKLMGEVFKESMDGGWFGWGTDEDLLNALIGQIRNREDYLQVNALYDGDLIDDIDAEDSSWKRNNAGPQIEALKRAIGGFTEADERGFKPRVTRSLEAMKVEPTVDNIKNFRNNITLKNYENVDLDAIIYILDEVNNIVAATTGATEEQQEEFLLIVENFEETFGEQTIGRRNSGGYGGGVQTGAELIGQWKLNNSEQWF
jgi:hypothetical protein